MHYCFEAAHGKLAAARQWASGSDRDAAKESEILQGEKEINAQLDDLAGRLNAFSSLALYQMEQIRVKYRPVGFLVQRAARPQHTERELLPDPHRSRTIPVDPISAAAPP